MCHEQCALNHDAIEFLPLSDRCHKQTDYAPSCGYHLYTDDLLWRNFLSPQCTNCSHDPDHAHLGSTHSSQDKTKTSHGRPVYKIWSLSRSPLRRYYIGCKILKRVSWPWPRPFREDFSSAGWDLLWQINVPNLKSLGSAVTKLWMAVQNAENGVVSGS